MSQREIPKSDFSSEIKNRILDTATELFAINGFGAVSIQDIADACSIKKSAFYYYFEGKEALLENIFQRFEKNYRHFLDWLTVENNRAESLDEVLDNMFCKEFIETTDSIGRLGMSLILKEQHSNEYARKLFCDLIIDDSINRMKADYDRLIKKGVIPESNTKMVATISMFHVLVMNEIRIHELNDHRLPIDIFDIFDGMRELMTLALTTSNPQPGNMESNIPSLSKQRPSQSA